MKTGADPPVPEDAYQIVDALDLPAREAVLKLRWTLKTLEPGAIVLLKTDARDCVHDVPAFCSQAGHSLLFAEDRDGTLSFYIEKHPA